MKKIDFFANTIKGRRQNNEDNCIAIQLDTDNYLFAVADGMGGAAAGEIASSIAINELEEFIRSSISKHSSNNCRKTILKEAYHSIQGKIASHIEAYPEYRGMGTTLCVLWVNQQSYVWANLGDSRIYLIQRDTIQQITKDHTYIQDYKDKYGTAISPELAGQYGNLIMRSLDGGEDEPDIFPLAAEEESLIDNSAFLLCSDGLILDKLDHINNEFHHIFLESFPLNKTVNTLIDFAYSGGSNDNITAVVAENGHIKRKRISSTKKVISLLALFIIAIASLSYLWLSPSGQTELPKEKISLQQNDLPRKNTSAIVQQKINLDSIKYNPFGRSIHRQFNLDQEEALPIMTLDIEGIHVIKYTHIFKDESNRIVEKVSITTDQLPIHIDKNLKHLKKGKYSVAVHAILDNGEKKIGNNERVIEIK